MAEPVAKKDDSLAKEELRQYLREIDVEIVREFDEGEFNGFWVKFGDFPLLLENQKGRVTISWHSKSRCPKGRRPKR